MGVGNSAVNQAQSQNTAQQEQIQASIDAINKAYSSPARTAGQQQYGQELGAQLTQNVNDQEAVKIGREVAAKGDLNAGSSLEPTQAGKRSQNYKCFLARRNHELFASGRSCQKGLPPTRRRTESKTAATFGT